MSPPDISPEMRSLLEEAVEFESCTRSQHEYHRRRFEKFYKMYRSYKGLRADFTRAESGRDVGDILQSARAGFGTDLFIPMVFGIVETTLPRMLGENPRLLVTPGDPDSEDNVDGMKLMVNRQQERRDFPLASQSVAKSGLQYGLGVGKTPWIRETKHAPVLQQMQVAAIDPQTQQPAMQPVQVQDPQTGAMVVVQQPVMTLQWVPSEERVEQVKYEGPTFEACDIFDWIWDPDAYDMRTLERCIDRRWRSDRYCKAMFDSKAWVLPEGWTLEDALRGGSRSKRDEVWGDRMAAIGEPRADSREREIHEVWEYWGSDDQVIVVLDRQLVVASGPRPYWHGEMPFQIYRPTEVLHEMVGIGEIEAVEDLQLEINTLRSQRRDNAALVLQRPFAYYDGFLDPEQIDFGAGKMWPMDGPPSEIFFPIPLQDIPFSSYREEDSLKADADRASGLSDTVMGGSDGGAPETATGLQMVHTAAGIRIQFKTSRFERETVKSCCRQWVALNQQYVVSERVEPGPPKPGEGDREFSWYKLGPAELAGSFAIEPEGGSMSPQNEVVRQQQAVAEYTLLRPDPLINPIKVVTETLTKLGKKNPEAWLAPQMPMVDPRALDLVRDTLAAEQGVDPAEFDALVQEAEQEVMAGATDQTFGSVGDQVPESRQAPAPPMAAQGPPPGR